MCYSIRIHGYNNNTAVMFAHKETNIAFPVSMHCIKYDVDL